MCADVVGGSSFTIAVHDALEAQQAPELLGSLLLVGIGEDCLIDKLLAQCYILLVSIDGGILDIRYLGKKSLDIGMVAAAAMASEIAFSGV